MITKSKLNQKTKLKILALVPVSAVVFIAIACLNGLYPPKVKANPDFGKAFFRPKIVNSRQIPESIENDDTTKQIKIRKHKKENQSEEIKVIGNGDAGTVKDTSKLIYIVDGVQIKEVKSINPDQIESVNVLKDDNLIIVHTKNYVQSKPSFAIKNTKTANPNVIYFVDGVEQPIGMDLNSINKDSIQSISIIKSDQIKLFTNKKCDGLILITTKK